MEQNEFGLTYKVEGVGVVQHARRLKSLHGAKSVAGRAFHQPSVVSVCVYDFKGVARLYLKKIEGGYIREVRG